MKLDVSAAPEMAVWTLPTPPVTGEAVETWPGRLAAAHAVRPTVGYLAACLRILAADPRSWWDRVRFDPRHPVHIAVDAPSPRCAAWLLVLPPGYQGQTRDWQVACLVAGEVADQAGTPERGRARPLSPGRIRVRGGGGGLPQMINTGGGYAVTLHARQEPVLASPMPGPPVPAGSAAHMTGLPVSGR
jgi:hypothetical protein